MNLRNVIWLAIGALILLSACSTRVVMTEYPTGHESELTSLGTYCWADTTSPEQNALEKQAPTDGHHQRFDPVVHNTVDEDLTAKGYRLANCGEAAFAIDYRMGSHEDVAANDATTTNPDQANPYGVRWRLGDNTTVDYQGLTAPKETVITVRHGTLHIAAFTREGRMLWHRSAEKNLGSRDAQENPEASVAKTVHRVMEDFPSHR